MITNNIQMTLLAPDTYLWLLVALAAVVSVTILFFCHRSRHKWLRLTGALVVLLVWYVLLYGTFVGVRRLEVRQVEYVSKDLPAAFDGYRIVQFGDAHVGAYTGWREPILQRAIDTINAQKADLIVFTGDLQNKVPQEIEAHLNQLSRLKAKDGICSVLGNHDYPEYIECDNIQKGINIGQTCNHEEDMGWFLLLNSYHRIRRGSESIVIAGMENDGEGRFPKFADLSSSLIGLNRQAFVIMLEHDPSSWRRRILPHSHCQLTLSGHTHGGQFSLFGLTPAMIRYRDYSGMYYAGERAMNVTTGLGGVIPFRFGVAPEIVVITLKRAK